MSSLFFSEGFSGELLEPLEKTQFKMKIAAPSQNMSAMQANLTGDTFTFLRLSNGSEMEDVKVTGITDGYFVLERPSEKFKFPKGSCVRFVPNSESMLVELLARMLNAGVVKKIIGKDGLSATDVNSAGEVTISMSQLEGSDLVTVKDGKISLNLCDVEEEGCPTESMTFLACKDGALRRIKYSTVTSSGGMADAGCGTTASAEYEGVDGQISINAQNEIGLVDTMDGAANVLGLTIDQTGRVTNVQQGIGANISLRTGTYQNANVTVDANGNITAISDGQGATGASYTAGNQISFVPDQQTGDLAISHEQGFVNSDNANGFRVVNGHIVEVLTQTDYQFLSQNTNLLTVTADENNAKRLTFKHVQYQSENQTSGAVRSDQGGHITNNYTTYECAWVLKEGEAESADPGKFDQIGTGMTLSRIINGEHAPLGNNSIAAVIDVSGVKPTGSGLPTVPYIIKGYSARPGGDTWNDGHRAFATSCYPVGNGDEVVIHVHNTAGGGDGYNLTYISLAITPMFGASVDQ